jgi:uncharacterized repeat protein (TIGR04076 family)
MRTINVKPAEISGRCRANLTADDEFQIRDSNLENPRQSRVCYRALANFPPIVDLLQQNNHFYALVLCPECPARSGCENSVTFLLGHADKWDLCQTIAEYRRLWKNCPESEPARQLRMAATRHQNQGEYTQAAETLKAALAEMKRLLAVEE